MVLGPDQVPVITDLNTARRHPELTVMSVMAHGDAPDPAPIFTALLTALDAVDRDHADLYNDLVYSVLSAAARDRLEEFMTTTGHRYQSEFANRYFSQGEAKGEAKALLTVLEARGIEVPEEFRQRIVDCTDVDQLDNWVRRAATITKIEDLDS